jgi:hypothetical protein
LLALLFLIIATFGGLFDFPDLLDGQLELFSPPDSDELVASERTKDEEDPWYNIPSDLEDEDDDLVALSFTSPNSASTCHLYSLHYAQNSTQRALHWCQNQGYLYA